MPRIALLLKVPGYSKGVGKAISILLFENTKAFLEFLRKDGIKCQGKSRKGTYNDLFKDGLDKEHRTIPFLVLMNTHHSRSLPFL